MAATLTPEQIAIVKATAPVLKEHGTTITTLFYNNMLDAHPELKNIFSLASQTTGRQPRALAASVLAYATYIDDLAKLQHAVERIAHKHVSLQVTPEQYDIVGKFLIEAIGQVLQEAATPEIVDAWTHAYAVLAGVFIGLEGQMYAANRAEGWAGWRKFRIVRKIAESETITTFYLAPSDGAVPLPTYLPGQYVSLQLFVPSLGHLQSRQYSLSEAPREGGGDYYRISVKREAGEDEEEAAGLPGVISNLLHDGFGVGDEVELSHPQGEFFVDPRDKAKEGAPAVLISAGVGATPLMAILGSLAGAEGKGAPPAVRRPVSWIHTSRSSNSLPFGDAVRAICRENEHVSAHVFLNAIGTEPQEKAGVNYKFAHARLDLDKLDRDRDLFAAEPRAEYFICGPETFMADVRRGLVDMGIDKERIYLELFATGDMAAE